MASIAAPVPSLGRVAWPLGVLALGMAAGFAAMGSFGTVQESAKAELLLSDRTLGLVQGVAAAVPLALFSVPVGIMVDRWNRVRLFLALAMLWTLGTLLTAYAPDAASLFVARMMTGTGATGALTAALSLAADLCQPAQRGRAMLVVTLGKTLGMAAGFGLVGTMFGGLGDGIFGLPAWRGVHVALAAILALCLLPLLTLREPARREVATQNALLGIVARELWTRRGFLAPLFLGQVSVVMADNSALIWAAPVLGRHYGLGPDQFAGWMGALIFGTGLGGAILGGLAADWGQRSGRRGGVLRGALIAAAIGAPAALFPVAGSVPLFAVAMGVLVLCGTVTGLITSVALTVLIPNEARGLCIGLFIAVAGVIGFGIAPSMVAWVSGMMGGEGHLAPALAIVGVVTGVIAVVAFALAIRNAPAAPVR
ncbi:MFS transporter [Sphingomonas jatrophae]|uniref:Predicted arabinose efflux permease, MFS family n=1 Tax=Sphingomonas jatrophae TaxID=1166337 RepID=A0A1I6M2H9_9SPHN|nr:MFS transporter [Sphingomonas jatrophae]SFS09896.1 Predicted arabinose efflux permease, MFS family [Sphingomonas jatrophae]